MSADTLIRAALDAGVEIRFVDGKLIATGKRSAVARMVEPLRKRKTELLLHFTQTNKTEPPHDPEMWHLMDRVYQNHHVRCPTCIAAGKGYGLRCGVGAIFWATYLDARTPFSGEPK